MKEDHLESACMDWLGELGWTCMSGDDVSPGGPQSERARYSDVVLVSRLREAAVRLNPDLSPTEIDEVVDKLSGYGAQSLVDGNKESTTGCAMVCRCSASNLMADAPCYVRR